MSGRWDKKIEKLSDSKHLSFCVHPKSYFLGDLKLHAKFHNTMITSSGRTVTAAERKKEREKNDVNSGHLVP